MKCWRHVTLTSSGIVKKTKTKKKHHPVPDGEFFQRLYVKPWHAPFNLSGCTTEPHVSKQLLAGTVACASDSLATIFISLERKSPQGEKKKNQPVNLQSFQTNPLRGKNNQRNVLLLCTGPAAPHRSNRWEFGPVIYFLQCWGFFFLGEVVCMFLSVACCQVNFRGLQSGLFSLNDE